MSTIAYVDVNYAAAYLLERLGTEAWDTATDLNRTKALAQATRKINRLNLLGVKTDNAQVNAFPRDGETFVPEEVKQCCVELALAYLQGRTEQNLNANKGVSSESVGDASTSYDGSGDAKIMEDFMGLTSQEAFELIAPWLHDPTQFDHVRVN